MRAKIKYVSAALLLIVLSWLLLGCSLDNIRPRIEQELVGTWIWNDYIRWTITFGDDGTGSRGIPEEMESFSWEVTGDTLRKDRIGDIPTNEIRHERWSFDVIDDSLRLASHQYLSEYFHTLAGVLGEVEPKLVGSWTWESNPRWVYQFNADGTGGSGWYGQQYSFRWGVVNNIIRMEFIDGVSSYGFTNQWWEFTIDVDTLRLENRHFLGAEDAYYYIRN